MKHLKFLLSSLFSNKRIIDDSKHTPWWIAIIVLIVSCALTIINPLRTAASTSGSQIITTQANYNLDVALKELSYSFVEGSGSSLEGFKAQIKNNTFELKDKSGNLNSDIHTISSKYSDGKDVVLMYVCFLNVNTSTDIQDEVTRAVNNTIAQMAAKDVIKDDSNNPIVTDGKVKSKVHPMLIFTQNSFILYAGNSEVSFAENASQLNVEAVSSLTSSLSGVAGVFTKLTNEDLCNISSYYNPSLETKKEAYDRALESWKSLFNEANRPLRFTQAGNECLTYVCISLGITLLMGLMLFLMSKTKSSVKKYGFLESLKMMMFALLCPSLLALLLAFLLPQFGNMLFILFIGVRATWLSMRATSGDNSQSNAAPIRK